MSDKLKEIQTAIDNFQMDEARRLVREELQDNPSADSYYLASQAAANHGQRVQFLEKAIELDPFHQIAHDELASIMPAHMNASAIPTTPLIQKPKTKNMPTYPLATIGKRFLAMLLDALILGVIGEIYNAVFGSTLPDNILLNDMISFDDFLQLMMPALVVSILISAIYHIFFMTRTNGQTPGKRALGIRVVKKDGTPITFIDALLRNVVGYTLSGIFALGYIWALFDSEKQGWHDKIAGTTVVDEPQKPAPHSN
jgi:uncharacterized RDD family membrane protein YckC